MSRFTFAALLVIGTILLPPAADAQATISGGPGTPGGPGAGNAQKLFALRSAEYEALRTLYIEQGIALPFSSGPLQ